MWHLLVSSCVKISQLYSVSGFKLVGYNVSYVLMLDIDAWPTASKALMGI